MGRAVTGATYRGLRLAKSFLLSAFLTPSTGVQTYMKLVHKAEEFYYALLRLVQDAKYYGTKLRSIFERVSKGQFVGK